MLKQSKMTLSDVLIQLQKIFEQLGKKKATAIPKTKHNYQQWYKPGTFSSVKQFSDIKRLFHDRYLTDDHSIHDELNGI